MSAAPIPSRPPLYVLVATPSGGDGQGGIDRLMAALRGELDRQGRPDLQVRFRASRGPGSIALAPFYLLGFCLRLLMARLAGRVDVVHLNLASDGSTYRKLVLAAWARLLGVPYVLHLHGAGYREFWTDQRPVLSRCIRQLFEHAAQVVVLGQVWRDFIAARAPGAADRIVVVPNATAVPALAHVESDSVRILFLGRLGDRKGVPQLVEALGRLKPNAGWLATIAGDGAIAATQAQITALGLDERVALPGWVGPETVATLLAAADILVLPSFAENLPVSVIEGMAAGLAIVATPVGAVTDIITDGQSGLLVPPGDVAALTDALTLLLDDPALRVRLGAAATAVHRARLDLPPFATALCAVWQTAALARVDRARRQAL